MPQYIDHLRQAEVSEDEEGASAGAEEHQATDWPVAGRPAVRELLVVDCRRMAANSV